MARHIDRFNAWRGNIRIDHGLCGPVAGIAERINAPQSECVFGVRVREINEAGHRRIGVARAGQVLLVQRSPIEVVAIYVVGWPQNDDLVVTGDYRGSIRNEWRGVDRWIVDHADGHVRVVARTAEIGGGDN